jgi:pyrimidine-nucleoside phosphorylase
MLQEALDSGRALEKALEWIAAQGGDVTKLDAPPYGLRSAPILYTLPAPRAGVIAGIDAMQVGLTAVDLGAGRHTKGDPIDHAVGIVLQAKVGARVQAGDPLLEIHASTEAQCARAQERLLAAYSYQEHRAPELPLVYKVID